MALINIKIEGVPYQVEEGLTILEAAKACEKLAARAAKDIEFAQYR